MLKKISDCQLWLSNPSSERVSRNQNIFKINDFTKQLSAYYLMETDMAIINY